MATATATTSAKFIPVWDRKRIRCVWINPDYVQWFQKDKGGSPLTYVSFGGSSFLIDIDPADFAKMLAGGRCDGEVDADDDTPEPATTKRSTPSITIVNANPKSGRLDLLVDNGLCISPFSNFVGYSIAGSIYDLMRKSKAEMDDADADAGAKVDGSIGNFAGFDPRFISEQP